MYDREFRTAFASGSLVAVDESGFDQRATPLYAYATVLRGLSTCRSEKRKKIVVLMAQAFSAILKLPNNPM